MIGRDTQSGLRRALAALRVAECGAMRGDMPAAREPADRAFAQICTVLARACPGQPGGEARLDLAPMSKLCVIALDLEAVISAAALIAEDLGEFYSDLGERVEALIENRPVRIAPLRVTAASPVAGTA